MEVENDAKTVDSSTTETTVDTTGAIAGNEANGANGKQDAGAAKPLSDSSTEGTDSGAKGPSTSLEAAKAALGTTGTAADSPTAGKSEGDKRPAETKTEDDKASVIDKAIADQSLPFHKHPRWKEVTEHAKAIEGQVTELTPKAQRMDAIDARFRETGLSSADVEPLFTGGAMLKRAGVTPDEIDNLMKVGTSLKLGDREVVMQLAGPALESLGLQIVSVLPKDIQDRIDQGAMSEDDGKRMADVAFQAKREKFLRERAEGDVQQRDNATATADENRRFTAASSAWEAGVKQRDADFAVKEPHIVEEITRQIALSPPRSEQDVVAICQGAYDRVSKIMRTGAPSTKPRPVTPARSGSSTVTTPVPRSSLEAARIGLNRG